MTPLDRLTQSFVTMSSNGITQRTSRLDQYRSEKSISNGTTTLTTMLDTSSSDVECDNDDLLFTIKKKLTQFWNEPEMITVGDYSRKKKTEDSLV